MNAVERTGTGDKPQTPHQREPDEQEGANRPLQAKDRPPVNDPDRDPHAALNNPVDDDPDPAATADPYDKDPASQGDV